MGNSRGSQIRRRQQIRRQMIIGGGMLVLVVMMAVSISSRRSDKREEEAKAAAKIEQEKQEEHREAEKEEKQEKKPETAEERLARVKVQAQAAGYPKGVIELLDKNPSTVDFVENYGEKQGKAYANTLGESLVEGEIPKLLQWDERWGYAPYGTSNVAVSGCGPTCLAMVVAGLTKNPFITPDKMAAFGTENKYVDNDNNTLWLFMEEAGANWGITAKEVPLDEQKVRKELESGHPIICSVTKGDFTDNGHFIILTGYQEGMVTVNDPFSRENTEQPWVFAEIANQIAAMWAYSAGN